MALIDLQNTVQNESKSTQSTFTVKLFFLGLLSYRFQGQMPKLSKNWTETETGFFPWLKTMGADLPFPPLGAIGLSWVCWGDICFSWVSWGDMAKARLGGLLSSEGNLRLVFFKHSTSDDDSRFSNIRTHSFKITVGFNQSFLVLSIGSIRQDFV